jgi:hypothetical protein
MSARTAGPFGSWLSVRHSLRAEAALVLVLYGLYELARGMVVGNAAEAVRHARQLVALERSTGLFFEERMQDAAHAFPGLIDLLGISYLTFHLAVTVGVLLWLHWRRPAAFPLVRTTLVLASGLALVGYLVYPTAPPRLSGIGITDTVSGGHVDLNSGLVSSLYNPYAAVPSMHFGYALVVGTAVTWVTHRRLVQATAAFYPAFVLLVVVATGNHFLLDVLAGAVVVGVAGSVALLLARPASGAAGLARFPERKAPAQAPEPAGPGGRRRLCGRGQRDRRPTPDEDGRQRPPARRGARPTVAQRPPRRPGGPHPPCLRDGRPWPRRHPEIGRLRTDDRDRAEAFRGAVRTPRAHRLWRGRRTGVLPPEERVGARPQALRGDVPGGAREGRDHRPGAPVPRRPPLGDHPRGGDGSAPAAIQARAGHADFSTTQRYINLAGVIFRDEAERAEARILGPGYRIRVPNQPTRRQWATENPPISRYFPSRGDRTRTCNPRFWRPVRYQLRHAPGLRR